ncbi:nucleoside-diphosphate sugar epimerase/dehydratase [Ravibacter arvi]|uniref:Nucleoside-diphosphate sugar epimerase/dehydratase n=1 Tax=Ravibacter arvi TaxID=2051041 RepID=A0ABP8M6D7_9BACT
MKSFFNRFHNQFLSRWVVLLMDVFIVTFAFMLSTVIRFNFELDYIDPALFKYHLVLVVAVKMVFFVILRTHAGIVRHTNLLDARNIVNASLLSVVTLFLLGSLGRGEVSVLDIPHSILVIDLFVSVFAMLGSRVLVKDIFRSLSLNWKPRKKVVIYGAGRLGIATKNALSGNLGTPYKVLFFVDDNPQKKGMSIEGINVYDRLQAKQVIQEAGFKDVELIFAIQSITTAQKNEITEEFMSLGMALRIVPPVEQWINGQLNASQIADVSIEDLLERPAISIRNDEVRSFLHKKRIMVTGAAGSIGSEIARQVIGFRPQELILVDQAESPLYDLESELVRLGICEGNDCLKIEVENITSRGSMRKVFARYRPEVVFHAAAYKHVPLMENNPNKALEVNVFGTRLMADLSVEFGVGRFVFISTDKAVNPTNVMGASKRLAEMYVQSLNTVKGVKTRFITTRFGNVLGSNGSVIPLFKRQIAAGGPVTVTHPEIIRYFMTIPEACQLVLEAGTMGEGGEIFVFDMGVPVKIIDLAHKMIRLSGKEPYTQIPISFTGLRPGEKLYEELLSDEESTLPTHHPKIMVARMKPSVYYEVKQEMDRVSATLSGMSQEEVVQFLKFMVPEYISKNSPYEKLDHVEL